MRKLASIQRIWQIDPIEGADRIELARPFGHQGLDLTRLPFRHMRKNGGPGRTRTFGVSDVTVLQTAGFAACRTDPYGCGGGIRTHIFRLMRPLSCQLTTPQNEAPKNGAGVEERI